MSSVNPLAALHPNVYKAMELLAEKREKGWSLRRAEDELGGHRLVVTALDRARNDNLQVAIQEVWLNKRPAAYYRRLAELARRRDEGQSRFQAHKNLAAAELPERDTIEGRKMIELVWGGSDDPVVKLLLAPTPRARPAS